MSSATTLYLVVLIFLSCSGAQTAPPNKEGYYTIIVPGTIRSESLLHVSMGLSDFHQSCWFNITLLSSLGPSTHEHVLRTIEIHPNTVKLVELQVPALDSKRGRLEIVGYSGIISRDSADINFEHDSYSVFIQANKPKYKLGELVQFRVICIDQLTRPAQIDKPISVLIYDSQENLIKQFSNVRLVQGVFKGDFQLSDYPVLGEWMIKVEVGGNASAEKSFQVEKYVLPKFLVRILTKSNVALDENKIVLAVSANYFYGESVKGNVTILLKRTHPPMQDDLPILKKESHINEKTSFNLDMKNDLKIENTNGDRRSTTILSKFNVKAIVTDALTEQQSTNEVEIIVHSQHYKINLQAPKVFVSEAVLKFMVKISVTDLLEDKLIDSPSSTGKITLECYSSVNNFNLNIDSMKTEFTHLIGKDYANIQIENQNFAICKLYAEYQGVQSPVEQIKKNEDTFYLDVLTESPEVGKELEVILKSLDPIEHFSFEIVSRGDIIQSEYINVPGDQTSYIFRFNVTFAMVPKITIYAHRIRKRIFAGQLKEVYIKRTFQNSIKILTDNETKPGSPININVTTDEDSYVGLMGLDHKILQNLYETSSDKSSDDLTENHFYTKLRNYDALSIDTSTFPGIKAGLITFSNAFTKIGSRFGEAEYDIISSIFSTDTEEILPEPFDKPSLELPRIRKIFSESWLFKDIERTPAGGFNLLETVPDTITSWAITGFSLNPKTGLTLTKNATNLKVFQEFFVSFDLPSLVTEGETIEVPIYISNYMNQDALTNVIIDKDSDYFEILKQPDAALKPNETISKLIPARMRAKIKVFMKPLKAGQFNVNVKAIAPMMASDGVQKTLKVKSEGIPYEFSNTYSIHLPEDGIQENDITVDIPEEAVPGSQSVEISIVGDIFGPLMRSLQKMARVPYGNGEENMRFVISNLLVLKYLKALNYTFPSLESKIKLNLELGYQNQLCFKHLDGSFGIFDRTIERSGDIWQTAFALWGLKENSFIHVDTKVFERGLNYLKTRQQENGCFESRSGIEEDIEYTAFSLMVFLMDNHCRTTHFEVISKGLKYLYDVSDSLGQSSISVLSTYVLLLGRHEKAGDRLKKLTADKLLTSIDKQLFWKKSDNLQSHLETTAESLMMLFESQKNPRQSLLHITRGLTTSEDGKSSLTHIIALHSLLVFVEDLKLSKKNLTTFFSDDHIGSGHFHVNSGNSQVLQTLKLSDKSRSLHLQSKGYGFAVVDVKYKYNLVIEHQSSSAYDTNITTATQRSSNSLAYFEVCASGLKNNSENYLTVMEVTLQSGYIFTEKITPQVGLTWKFKSLIVNDNQDKLVIYIANLNKNGICLKLESLEKYKVLNAKPGLVVLYDMHKKGEKSAKSFKIHDS